MSSRPGFDEWVLECADAVARRSRDPSTKVGCVIVRPDKSFAAVGYNGFPRSMEDRGEWWDSREEKYDRVIHAEMNALAAMKEPARGCIVYVTHPPCKECTKFLAAHQVAKVVWRHNDGIQGRFDTTRSEEILTDCGIAFEVVG
nr:deaminase [uncultured Cohaesibacter sp.]